MFAFITFCVTICYVLHCFVTFYFSLKLFLVTLHVFIVQFMSLVTSFFGLSFLFSLITYHYHYYYYKCH